MSPSKRNRKQNRQMRRSRLQSVRQIEQTKPSYPSTQPALQDPQKTVDPATQHQIQELRQLGLSVSPNASPEKLRALRDEFDLARRYVQDVVQTLAPDTPEKLSSQQLDRFTAMLFGNGRLIDYMATNQRARSTLALAPPPLAKTPEFKQVARMLRRQFADVLPALPWWARLLGG